MPWFTHSSWRHHSISSRPNTNTTSINETAELSTSSAGFPSECDIDENEWVEPLRIGSVSGGWGQILDSFVDMDPPQKITKPLGLALFCEKHYKDFKC